MNYLECHSTVILCVVKREGQCRGHTKLTGSNRVNFIPFQELSGKARPLEIARAGPPGLGSQILPIDKRGPTIHSTRTQSASILCHSSLVGLFLSPIMCHICVS